jgi:hypothetical protein
MIYDKREKRTSITRERDGRETLEESITDRTGNRNIALPFLDHGTRRG